MTKAMFNQYRFEGLNPRDKSNKYLTMKRVADDGSKIVVKVDRGHILPTRYGYALILDDSHVVFLKDWQVSDNWFGCEVLLNREFWKVKEWGCFPDYMCNEQNLSFDTWLNAAKAQGQNPVAWAK